MAAAHDSAECWVLGAGCCVTKTRHSALSTQHSLSTHHRHRL